jgi:hypothetical protein
MANKVENIILDILKNIQAGIAQFRAETNDRFDRLEAAMRKDRRNVSGMLVMMRATAGDFDERVSDIEERVAKLEARLQ